MSYAPWLQQVTLPYSDPGRTYVQVDVLLQRVNTLKPKTDNFMRLGPPPQLLICLFGSMSCQYQANSFTFNIEIWLPRTFPFQAPFVFVCPTGNQRLRTSALVDPAGRVIHSYLTYWHTRSTSTLIEMMNYLHQAFCQDPPIFLDQPAARPPPPPPQQNQHAPPPRQAQATAPKAPENTTANLMKLRVEVKENLLKKYKQLQQEISIDTDRILAENSILCENETKLKRALGDLRKEIVKVKDEVGQAKARNASLAEQIVCLKEKGEVDLDKLIIPQGSISKQLMKVLIDELVIEDTLYTLTKGFEKKKIDLQTFLRMTRDLASEQFHSKALILKIRDQYPVFS